MYGINRNDRMVGIGIGTYTCDTRIYNPKSGKKNLGKTLR